MRITTLILSGLLGATLICAAHADIYQSKDAQGNTVFSDQPSQGAHEVKVRKTNSADPVAIPPPRAAEPTTEAGVDTPTEAPRETEQQDEHANPGESQ